MHAIVCVSIALRFAENHCIANEAKGLKGCFLRLYHLPGGRWPSRDADSYDQPVSLRCVEELHGGRVQARHPLHDRQTHAKAISQRAVAPEPFKDGFMSFPWNARSVVGDFQHTG